MILPSFSAYLTPPADVPKGYFSMDEAAYHAYPAVSSGLLKEATQIEMLANRMAPADSGETKEDLVLGNLTHAVVLEPWKFSAENWQTYYHLCDTKKLNTQAADRQRERHPGKLLVTPELLTTAMAIRRETIETNPDAIRFLNSPDGQKEATGIVWDPVHQCRRKIRVDYLPKSGTAYGNYLLDIKTTRHALHAFEYEAGKLGYYQQAAYYLDTHQLITGHRMERFIWLVTTKTDPYMSRLFFMRNILPTDPLYKDGKCRLRHARERLGLDPSARVGRLTQFLTAARETEAMRTDDEPTAADVRRVWAGYEQEDMTEIF